MVVEHCRTLLGWEGANSTECDEATPHPVVIFMPEVDKKGAWVVVVVVVDSPVDSPVAVFVAVRRP